MVESIRNLGGEKMIFVEFEELGDGIWDRAITYAGGNGNIRYRTKRI